MKKITFSLSLVFFFYLMGNPHSLVAQSGSKTCTTPPAINTASLVGDWYGTCTFEGKTYHLKMNFQMQEGQLAAKASLPEMDLADKEYTTWVCRSNEVHLKLNLPNGKVVKFIGKPQNDEFAGRFSYQNAGVCSAASDRFSVKRTGV